MSGYDAILFDLDGTLWDASEASACGWNSALKSNGVFDAAVTPMDIKKVSGMPFRDCVATLIPGVSVRGSEDLIKAIDSSEKTTIDARGGSTYGGVEDGLKILADEYKLFLVSNCQKWYLDAFWNHVPMEPYFRASDCHGDSGESKADMIESAVQLYGLVKPIYIGDTEADEMAAHSAKVDFGYVAYGFGGAKNPTVTFQTFGELVAWFQSANAA